MRDVAMNESFEEGTNEQRINERMSGFYDCCSYGHLGRNGMKKILKQNW